GGWGAFDTDNTAAFLNEIPFADMRAMIDPPTEDLTGRLLDLMGLSGFDLAYTRARRARALLQPTHPPHRSWGGRWGGNFIYGTWSALSGLRAIGEDIDAPYVRRAASWLEAHQNPDGGWGETLASYDDESLAGRGESTPSQTAWALLGLVAGTRDIGGSLGGGGGHPPAPQRGGGGWEQATFKGTGCPGHCLLRDS